jgi:polyisoprenyl-teichoic acid--peptidoglycan teichoic acid transferase
MRPNVYNSHPRDSYPARLLRALLSALVPGVGQLIAGFRRRGAFLLAIFVVVTVAAAYFVTRGTDVILGWMLQPTVLLALLWVDIVVLLVRVYAVIDAWLRARAGTLKPLKPSGPGMFVTGVALALILVFTIAPHVVAGYYTLVSRHLLTTVFAGETTTTAQPASTSSSTGGSSSTATGGSATTARTSPAGSNSTLHTTTTAATTTTGKSSLAWGDDGRMTILLIGTDAGYGRVGARSDSMNVASIDMKTGRVSMFGLPRNTGSTPLGPKTSKALGIKTFDDMLNGLYTAAEQHPEIATDGGDPGAEAVMETASQILGIQIDYYAVVNMLGLVDVVDALGGVDVNLKTALHITYAPLEAGQGKTSYVFNVGVNHLDGLAALAYARDRKDSDDYTRMGRQRCILMAMLYQNSVAKLTLRFPKIAGALEKNVMTNIPVSALTDLIKLRSKVSTGNMITVGFTPPDWTKGYNAQGYNILDFPKVAAAVQSILSDPDKWTADHPAAASTGNASDCWKVDQ